MLMVKHIQIWPCVSLKRSAPSSLSEVDFQRNFTEMNNEFFKEKLPVNQNTVVTDLIGLFVPYAEFVLFV